MKDIKVMLFDDNLRIRESLSLLFNKSGGFIFCGAYPDNANLLDIIAFNNPDVILMDIDIPVLSGIEAVRLIAKNFPEIKVIMLTVFDDDKKIFDAICAGASGYILKNSSLDKITDAVADVSMGGAPMTPAIAKRVLELFQKQNTVSISEEFNISPREKEVLGLLVKGASYKMIADQLNISFETVHSHIKKIYRKLQVNSMSEAVAKAINNKLT